MYLRQTCNIEIAGKYRLRGLHGIEIKKSIHQIIQSAKLELPLSVLKRNNKMLERIRLIDTIKEGDKIKIDLGYNGNNKTEFEGYIKHINTKQPLELEIEDDLYLLRKIILKKSFKSASVKDVLNYILKELFDKYGERIELYDKMPELTVKNFVMDSCTGIQALQSLVDVYPIFNSYLTTIDGKKILYCGLLYGLQRNRVKLDLNRNTLPPDDLKYDVKELQTYYLKIVNINPDGTKDEYNFGDKKDPEQTFYFNGTHTKEQLKQLADAQLQQQVTGYRGGIETFLIPNTQPGDIALITDQQYSREGRGYIGTVTTTFGSGARRKNEIDISI
jgi:hypothetical protein